MENKKIEKGIIIKMLSGFYYVKTPIGVITCKARGVMRKDKTTPLVGDYAEVALNDDNTGTVLKILNRKNFLTRPPVANVDKLFIVSSFATPKPNFYIIDTLIAICEFKGIEPVLVFNKSDLGDFSDYITCYEKVGYKVIVTSVKNEVGLDKLTDEFKNSVSVLTGNSGVGKSSILNNFIENSIKTGEVSQKLGRGRHTTRHTQFYTLKCGGYVADTPGFSSIELEKNDYSFKENLADFFVDFSEFSNKCKFTGCSHTGEKGCEVCKAVNNGIISNTRLESYKLLFNELKDLKKWQISK